jgi:cell division initiation protein
MKITPLDIQQHSFKSVLRGYDSKDVDVFLEMISSEMELLIRENNELKDTMKDLKSQVTEFKNIEKVLKDTILAAQKITDEMKSNAKKEGEVILFQAEAQADTILEKAYLRLSKVIEDIHEMKRQRLQFESSLKSLLHTHIKILNAKKDEEDKIDSNDAIETNLKVIGHRSTR